MLLLFVLLTISSAATVKQFVPTQKADLKAATKKYLKEDGYLTNLMDWMEVVEAKDWDGKKPELWDMKGAQYPYYNADLIFTKDEKQKIINENKDYMKLIVEHAFNGTLRRMPDDLGGSEQFEASEVNFGGKRLTVDYTINTRILDYRAVGWAFPGEVVSIQLPKDFDLNGLSVAIGKINRFSGDSHLNTNNWANVRMPVDTYHFALTDYKDYIKDNVFKIGSPIGGMVYFKIDGNNWGNVKPFTIRVSNIGRAPIYIYGQTTNEDYERELKNAPGNVVSILTPGARLEFVKSRLPTGFNPEEVLKWWYQVYSTADEVIGYTERPIVMFYDQRVDAGAAVAFVGRYFTQHPSDWATGAVDINGMLKNGQWGSLHEFHHHKQVVRGGVHWGIAPTGESTNNLFNAMNYIEYTNINAYRHVGLSDWNWVTDPYTTMKGVLSNSRSDQHPLEFYVLTIHGFGSAKMLQIMADYNTYKDYIPNTFNVFLNTSAAYTYIASIVTEHDMRYACKLLHFTDCNKVDSVLNGKNYPIFYPFFNKYCMTYNGIRYGRSYKIEYGEKITLNMTENTIIDPAATNVQITFTEAPKGTLKEVTANIYEYTPEGTIGDVIPFKVQIKCKVNGKDVTINQDGEFEIYGQFLKVKKYFNPGTRNITLLKEKFKNAEQNATYFNTQKLSTHGFCIAYSPIYMTGKGRLRIEKEGYYTFYMRGETKGEWILKYEDQTITLSFESHVGDYLTTSENLYKTLYMKVGLYEFELHNYGDGWNVYAGVAYCYHGTTKASADPNSCKPTEIPETMIFTDVAPIDSKDRKFVLPSLKYWRKAQYLTHSYRTIPLCQTRDNDNCPINCTQIPKDEPVEKSACSNIFDMQSSIYHTTYNTNTKFPATFEFAFPKAFSFNYYYLHHRNYRDSFGNYTMYGKLGSGEYETVHNVENKQGNIEQFSFDKMYTFDHIKFVVDNNIENHNFVVIQDLYFGIGAEEFANYSKPWGDNVESISGMEKVVDVGAYGNYLVQNKKAGSGRFCFNFQGTRFGFYGHRTSTSGSGKVTFNGGEEQFDMSYPIETLGILFYYHKFSNKGDHNVCVEITEGTVNFDVIGFD